ncbi:MAG TPA: response regulator, partial [Gammaproteobacteria bacterium]
MSERTVLVVDDEPNILRSLVRLLRRDGYNILTAGSGAEGLELLAQHEVEVIISDQRMPGMTGTEFLSRVKGLYPETVRIVLSGYTDLESITDAINHGAIYKFLTKPWDDDLLRDNVRQAIEQHELRAENRRLTEELSEANKALSLQLAEQDRELITHQRILELSRE